MAKYLVTGVAGFIGSSLALNLLANGDDVYGIDNFTTGYESNVPDDVKLIRGNCQDLEIIKKLNLTKFDAIFHIAGQSSGEISFSDPVYDLQTNTQSTLILLDFALKTKCTKFIYASSMSVYGDQTDLPVSEMSAVSPKSFYAVGKLASEQYLKIYSTFGIQCIALRLFNVYGPGQNMENLKQGMISIFLAQAIKNRKIIVKGSKNRYRDFVYIDDVVIAFIKALEIKPQKYIEFNIGTGDKTHIDSLLYQIGKILNYKIDILYKGSTPGDQFGIYADINKAKVILNWSPNVNIEKGLNNMIEWAISNPKTK